MGLQHPGFPPELLLSSSHLVLAEDAVEDVVVGLEPLGRPEAPARVQWEELERARFADGAIGGATKLEFNLDVRFDLEENRTC